MSDATTILLIDGDHHSRARYAHLLHTSSHNYDVVQAPTGRSGLDICARQPIDCVVLEIDLPDMSGFEVLVKLVPHAHRPEIAVVVVTKFQNQFLLDLAIKNGAHAAFRKETGDEDLLEPSILRAIWTVQARNRLVG